MTVELPDLSTKQRRIYYAIRRFQRRAGYCPSIREIQVEAGISSTSVVEYNLRRLEKLGLIERLHLGDNHHSTPSRTIRITGSRYTFPDCAGDA